MHRRRRQGHGHGQEQIHLPIVGDFSPPRSLLLRRYAPLIMMTTTPLFLSLCIPFLFNINTTHFNCNSSYVCLLAVDKLDDRKPVNETSSALLSCLYTQLDHLVFGSIPSLNGLCQIMQIVSSPLGTEDCSPPALHRLWYVMFGVL